MTEQQPTQSPGNGPSATHSQPDDQPSANPLYDLPTGNKFPLNDWSIHADSD